MKPMDLQREERLEELLRSAATWEPDTTAPEGLAAKALKGIGNQRIGHRLRWRSPLALLLTAGAAPAVAAGVLAVIQMPRSAPTASAPKVPLTQQASVKPSVEVEQSEPTSPEKAPVWEPDQPRVTSRKLKSTRRWRAPRRSVSPVILASKPGGRSHWTEETVEVPVNRVVTNGWLVEPNPEDGTYRAVPAVATVTLCGPADPDPAEQPGTQGVQPTTPSENSLPADPQAGALSPSGTPTPGSDNPNPAEEKKP